MTRSEPVPGKVDLRGMTLPELQRFLEPLGKAPYRARQIMGWLYRRPIRSFDEMTNLAKAFRRDLDRVATVGWLEVADRRQSADGTVKYAWGLHDGTRVESVLIPEPDRLTLCISTQVGCPLGCRFCATGQHGYVRNLTASEILSQIVQAQLDSPERKISNLVLMGMGEPLLNLDAVLRASDIAMVDEGLNFSHRRITLSTVGLLPQLDELGRRSEINLAVSLHATTQQAREALMPVAARKLPLDQLIEACRRFPLPHRKLITFEYILFGGINDDLGDARRLIRLLHGVRAKVNLIPFNPHPGSEFAAPGPDAVQAYRERLMKSHIHCAVRASRGTDIEAACGQLVGHRDRGSACN